MFETKIAIVVREDPAVWQKLNVTGFLTSGIVWHHGNPAGRGLFGCGQPGGGEAVSAGADGRGRAALRDGRKLVDKITKGARMHP